PRLLSCVTALEPSCNSSSPRPILRSRSEPAFFHRSMNRSDFPHLQTRGDLFRQAACAAVGTLSIATTIRDLRFINTAAAQGTLNDYKALVCIFLSGGNDSNNLVVPTGADYAAYAASRQNLALPESSLLAINSANPDGHTYGLHPAM